METTHTHTPANRVLAAIAVLVVIGWAWSLSNVGIPDVVWLVNAALTSVLIGMLAFVGIQRLRRR